LHVRRACVPDDAAHGAARLPAVEVDSYNVEVKDDEGFIGDRANKGAFRDIVENWRKPLRKKGHDPFGDAPSDDLTKKEFDDALAKGDVEAAGIVQGAVEDFSQELAIIIRRFLKLKAWKDTQRLVIGGGFRASRVGEIAIGRTSVILNADGGAVDVVPIHYDPDEAGLIGAAHLAPQWLFKGYEAILGVDIGGTNIRAGAGKEKLQLAPFIGIGCPRKIEQDGTINRGAQNMPGNWESSKFNLPLALQGRYRHRNAQRRGGSGPERSSVHHRC
jgi:hypothetical protein